MDQHQKNGKGSWGTPQIREALEAILANDSVPPPSLGAVARRLGCDPASLLLHHKEVCNALTKRYQAYLQTKKQTDLHHYCEEVRQAARHIASQGIRPNGNQLGKVLKKPGILRSSEIREAWKEILREFTVILDILSTYERIKVRFRPKSPYLDLIRKPCGRLKENYMEQEKTNGQNPAIIWLSFILLALNSFLRKFLGKILPARLSHEKEIGERSCNQLSKALSWRSAAILAQAKRH